MEKIRAFLKVYETKDFYTYKKAEYSIVFILFIMLAMIIIMSIEAVIISATPFKLISSLAFIVAFVILLLIIRSGHYEMAVNLLILASFIRTLMIYSYPTPFQFYVMGVLSMITIAVIYTKNYQLYLTGLPFITLYIMKIPAIKQLVDEGQLHFRAYTQSIYSMILMAAVVLMLLYLRNIINKEIYESEKLIQYANTDPLTGLYNRRRLTELYDINSKGPVDMGIIILDIDYFKQVNDTFGHSVGDQVLVDLSDHLVSEFSDWTLCRWGGEEFLMMQPLNHVHVLSTAVTRLTSSIEKRTFGDRLKITVSAGATIATSYESLTEVVRRADKGLYQSKANGRNQSTLL